MVSRSEPYQNVFDVVADFGDAARTLVTHRFTLDDAHTAFETALDSWHAQQITVSAIVTSRTADVMNAGNAEAPGYDHTADEDDGICENESQAESVTRSAATTDA